MAVYADRVKETTETEGTGAYSLGGAQDGFETFVSGVGAASNVPYVVEERNGNGYEIGYGTVTDADPDTLSRDTILASSNGGSAVDWGSGTKDIWLDLPADRINQFAELDQANSFSDQVTIVGNGEDIFRVLDGLENSLVEADTDDNNGMLRVHNLGGGAGEYVFLMHTGSDARIASNSGPLWLGDGIDSTALRIDFEKLLPSGAMNLGNSNNRFGSVLCEDVVDIALASGDRALVAQKADSGGDNRMLAAFDVEFVDSTAASFKTRGVLFANDFNAEREALRWEGDGSGVNLRLGGDLSANNQDIENIRVASFNGEVDNGDSGASATIDWTAGAVQAITLTDDVTLSFTDPPGPARVQIRLVQDGTGNHAVTWPANVKWPGGTAPTITTDANAENIVTLWWNGSDYYATEALDFS